MKKTLSHGSNNIIDKPILSLGKTTNDYGKGFYCTEDFELACQWATKNNNNGYANEYVLDLSELKVLNLMDPKYTVLNWLAILLKNRTFRLYDETAIDAKEYLLNNFYIDTTEYDVVIGYRADDSYFSYAQSFISNSLSLKNLSAALKLGNLGTQIVLVSEKAFERLSFEKSHFADKKIYFPKFISNDEKAREEFQHKIKRNKPSKDDIYIRDIIIEEMNSNDSRIQRTICN